MNKTLVRSSILATFLFFIPDAFSQVFVVEPVGVQYETKAMVADTPLVLNGASDSTILSARATCIGLYLTEQHTTVEGAIAQKGPKRLRLVALRDILSRDLGNVLVDRIRNNSSQDEMLANMAQIGALGRVFGSKSKLIKGDVVTIDWLPQTQSTEMRLNDVPLGPPIQGENFYPLMMKVWLGPKTREATRLNLLGRSMAQSK